MSLLHWGKLTDDQRPLDCPLMPVLTRLLPALTALLVVAACSAPATQPTAFAPTTAAAARPAAAPVSGEIVVFAASSLTDAFQDLAAAFQQANPSARVT